MTTSGFVGKWVGLMMLKGGAKQEEQSSDRLIGTIG